MKVMKFGGTSVGSVESILSLKRIVEAVDEPVVVVVSALGGITDQLLRTARQAQSGDAAYRSQYDAICRRHHEMIGAVLAGDGRRQQLTAETDRLLGELGSIYQGVFLIRDLSPKTEAAIVSYGERLSSRIVATLVSGAGWKDSRQFIKTEHKHGRQQLDSDLTAMLVKAAFSGEQRVVVPGFISQDKDTGETTNLGRGGSDYTASIIAAALDADVLEIWTDVDGFMTADPRVIPTAYTIQELSYVEAMELCNFGAKVIYPPTIYPVCVKNIPIRVKNTFNPTNPGTIIRDHIENDRKPIKGISSISGTTLITVAGLSMVGVIGVNRRIFTTLAEHGISVFMVSQASSENSTSIGVRDEDAAQAVEVLNQQFSKEIETGAMFPMQAESGLATVAIVGENMKHTPGIAGKLFGTLGRSGISVIACAQGASETNISFVVESRLLRKSLNVLHDSFFLSEYNVLNLFICGVGTVGGNLIEQIRSQQQELMDKRRLKLNVVGIASSQRAVFTRDGIDLADYRRLLDESEPSGTERLRREVIGMNIFNSVFVDCTASADVAALYQDFLEHNISVVAANKTAASGPYDSYRRLKQAALQRGVKYRFETNVGAGLPIIGTIGDLRTSGDKILKIKAVLSGTLNFICNELAADVPLSQAVRHAKDLGYSEPDPRVDLSGLDVLRKIVILAREGGYRVEQSDVRIESFLPEKYFGGTLEEFWQQLPQLDEPFRQRCSQLRAGGKRLRYVATMDHGQTTVQLEAVEEQHPFFQLEASNNAVMLTTERYREFPMVIQGYGAGAGVTAAGVFANILSIANI
ncbi:MAG: bifunctional aspartate kinase/homoserine dehydrogenase I [Prevotella sp.]|nr:bifunctional aspartate kinase/homoserine dehydrogenase I [Prevotella sp.]